jgi:hypothetical protein
MPHADIAVPHADTKPHADVTTPHSDTPKSHTDTKHHSDVAKHHLDKVVGGTGGNGHTDFSSPGKHTDIKPQ